MTDLEFKLRTFALILYYIGPIKLYLTTETAGPKTNLFSPCLLIFSFESYSYYYYDYYYLVFLLLNYFYC